MRSPPDLMYSITVDETPELAIRRNKSRSRSRSKVEARLYSISTHFLAASARLVIRILLAAIRSSMSVESTVGPVSSSSSFELILDRRPQNFVALTVIFCYHQA